MVVENRHKSPNIKLLKIRPRHPGLGHRILWAALRCNNFRKFDQFKFAAFVKLQKRVFMHITERSDL